MAKICRVIQIKLNQLVWENVRTIAILLRKWCLLTSEQQTFRRSCPTKWQKTADMKKLRHCHPMYSDTIIPYFQSAGTLPATPNSLWRAWLMGVNAYFSNSGVISSDPAAFPFHSLLNWSVLWDSYVWSTCGCTILKVRTQTCRRMVQSSLIIFYTLLGGLFYCLA